MIVVRNTRYLLIFVLLVLGVACHRPIGAGTPAVAAPLPFDTAGAGRGTPPAATETRAPREMTLYPNASRDLSVLRFTSGSEVAGQYPRQLRAWTTVVNGGSRAVRFGHGACAHHIRLWRSAERRGAPVWRSEYQQPRRRPGERETTMACPMPLYIRQLSPGDSLRFDSAIALGDMLVDSMPDGRYFVGVELQLVDDSLRPPEWDRTFEHAAGEVALRRAPDPPPSVRMVGAVRVEAATRLVRGATRAADSVRTYVLVTNTGADSADVNVARDDPVVVYAFRTAADRDSLPLGRPAFTMPGAWHGGAHRFRLGPGRSWLFEKGVPASWVLASAGPGEYHFLVWMIGGPSPMLAAGSVRLAQ